MKVSCFERKYLIDDSKEVMLGKEGNICSTGIDLLTQLPVWIGLENVVDIANVKTVQEVSSSPEAKS